MIPVIIVQSFPGYGCGTAPFLWNTAAGILATWRGTLHANGWGATVSRRWWTARGVTSHQTRWWFFTIILQQQNRKLATNSSHIFLLPNKRALECIYCCLALWARGRSMSCDKAVRNNDNTSSVHHSNYSRDHSKDRAVYTCSRDCRYRQRGNSSRGNSGKHCRSS